MANIELVPLPGPFGVEVQGVDVAGGVDAETLHTLACAYVEHKLLLFRDQHPSPQAYSTFARQWGKPRYDRFAEVRVPGFDDMVEIGNVGGVDDINATEAYRNAAAAWHTDCAAEVEPNAATMLYCIHAPAQGGETMIADMQAAYDALAEATRNEIDGLTAYHCYSGTRKVLGGREEWEHIPPLPEAAVKQLPTPIARPVARPHSVTGRKGLYSPAGSIIRIEGMDHAPANDLMRQLKLHAIDDAFCYTHRYRPGDILMWDNTATMHCAKPIGAPTGEHDRRLLYRIVPLGVPWALNA